MASLPHHEVDVRVFSTAPAVQVSVALKDVSYTLRLAKAKITREIGTFGGNFIASVAAPFALPWRIARAFASKSKPSHQELRALENITATFRPGTMTLVLSPPGHGKSSLLKTIAGRIPAASLSGVIKFSGKSASDLRAAGISLARLAAYVGQADTHDPFLTVRETVAFAWAMLTTDPAAIHDTERAADAAGKIQRIIDLLSLKDCADTLIGDEMAKGISGGERRRVSIAEALVSNARVLALDEYSTGLDSSVTYGITASIRSWCVSQQGTVVAALLQATPEVYSLFDNVLLLREGRVVFHGPREALPLYMTSIGFTPPASLMFSAAHAAEQMGSTATASTGDSTEDIADWIIKVITQPNDFLKAVTTAERPILMEGADIDGLGSATSPSIPSPASTRSTSTTALVHEWKNSLLHHTISSKDLVDNLEPLELSSPFAKLQFGIGPVRSMFALAITLVARQWKVTLRNNMYIWGRILASLIVSVVLGSIWYKESSPIMFFGLFMAAVIQLGFGNFQEVPFAVDMKFVAYKHMDAAMYSGFAFALSSTAISVPICLCEALLFSVPVYFMTGLVLEASRFFIFACVLFLVNVSLGGFFRFVAYAAPNLDIANVGPGPVVSTQLLFAGFLLTPSKMNWLKFMHYFSVMGYGLRSMAQNEFLASKYSESVGGDATLGTATLSAFEIPTDPAWLWGGVAFGAGFFLLTNMASGAAMEYIRITRDIGTARQSTDECSSEANEEPVVGVSTLATESAQAIASTLASLPFVPMSIAWRDIRYSVTLPAAAAKVDALDPREKVLLHAVTGYAGPGQLLALMGASGAGKTTLLDVLGGRKSSGRTSGGVFLNGLPCGRQAYARHTAYCEQSDVHAPHATVQEALEFSAVLRLDASVSATKRAAFVAEVMSLLELESIKGRMIGEPGAADGLAPGERKLLSIGVELVSNSPILFLDEPTSGLDSRAALSVLRAIRKVASAGRTVIATIHQPSQELFSMFDRVLLLQRGGWQVFFGPLGQGAASLVGYIESQPNMRRLPEGMNPASWVLDALAGFSSMAESSTAQYTVGPPTVTAAAAAVGPASLDGEALQVAYFTSDVWAEQRPLVDACCASGPIGQITLPPRIYARDASFQFYALLLRNATSYWRNTSYNWMRWLTFMGLMGLFGIIYFGISKRTTDFAGLQSLVSVIFSSGLFSVILAMMLAQPTFFKGRAVFYRERAACMYAPEVHILALFAVEIPWIGFNVWTSMSILYFMAGLRAEVDVYFFFLLVVWIACLAFLSFGMLLSTILGKMNAAQGASAGILTMVFLFGGLLIPYSGLPMAWRWAYIMNPITYLLEATTTPQLHCIAGAAACPSIPFFCGASCPPESVGGYAIVQTEEVLQTYYGLYYDRRWQDVGILLAFVGALISATLIAVRFIVHQKR